MLAWMWTGLNVCQTGQSNWISIMQLSADEINALVWIALQGGKARAHWNHGKFKTLARNGFTEIIREGKVYTTYKLTRAGVEALLSIPDDYNAPGGFYPLPRDIVKAKSIVRGLAL